MRKFFDHYPSHIDKAYKKYSKLFANIMHTESGFPNLELLTKEMCARIANMATPFRDGMDIADDALYAGSLTLTGKPMLFVICLLYSAYEASKNKQHDPQKKGHTAIGVFAMALYMTFIYLPITWVSTIIGLLTRSIATAIQGWQPREERENNNLFIENILK